MVTGHLGATSIIDPSLSKKGIRRAGSGGASHAIPPRPPCLPATGHGIEQHGAEIAAGPINHPLLLQGAEADGPRTKFSPAKTKTSAWETD